mgnify:CR=1 FL=1
METLPFSFGQFSKAIPEVCAKGTAAADGKGWTRDNPTWGHCAVVALWVQNFYGGDLLRVSLEGTEFAEARSHYYNRTATTGGIREDFTTEQFQRRLFPGDLPFSVKDRAYVIGSADTRKRYAFFGVRLLRKLLPDNGLMEDAVYRACLYEALLSPCQKKGVGAVLVGASSRDILATAHNEPIPGLEDLCTPTCIRLTIPSRTESMLGACGHAEERLLWNAKNIHFLYASDMYVAGVTAQGLPERRLFPEFTCLRCAVAMHYAGLGAVDVAYNGERWIRQTTQEALASAKEYALGKKKA